MRFSWSIVASSILVSGFANPVEFWRDPRPPKSGTINNNGAVAPVREHGRFTEWHKRGAQSHPTETHPEYECSTPAPAAYHCDVAGTFGYLLDEHPLCHTADTTLKSCRDACIHRSDCVSFGFDEASSSCTLYDSPLTSMGIQTSVSCTHAYFSRHCFDCRLPTLEKVESTTPCSTSKLNSPKTTPQEKLPNTSSSHSSLTSPPPRKVATKESSSASPSTSQKQEVYTPSHSHKASSEKFETNAHHESSHSHKTTKHPSTTRTKHSTKPHHTSSSSSKSTHSSKHTVHSPGVKIETSKSTKHTKSSARQHHTSSTTCESTSSAKHSVQTPVAKTKTDKSSKHTETSHPKSNSKQKHTKSHHTSTSKSSTTHRSKTSKHTTHRSKTSKHTSRRSKTPKHTEHRDSKTLETKIAPTLTYRPYGTPSKAKKIASSSFSTPCSTAQSVHRKVIANPSSNPSKIKPIPSQVACNNQGLQWAYFNNTSGPNTDVNYTSFNSISYKGVGPMYSASTTSIGGIYVNGDSIALSSIYGSKQLFRTTYFVLNHRGYIYIPRSGNYKIVLSDADDIALVWFGKLAFTGWTNVNANVRVTYVGQHRIGAAGSTYSTYATGGTYVPIRIMYANAQSVAQFSVTIYNPDGSVLLDSKTDRSPYVVQYSCDGLLAPEYPAWDREL